MDPRGLVETLPNVFDLVLAKFSWQTIDGHENLTEKILEQELFFVILEIQATIRRGRKRIFPEELRKNSIQDIRFESCKLKFRRRSHQFALIRISLIYITAQKKRQMCWTR